MVSLLSTAPALATPASAGSLTSVVADGNLLFALVIAVAAGLVSFASPCVLPLVPGFLGYVTGSAQVGPRRSDVGTGSARAATVSTTGAAAATAQQGTATHSARPGETTPPYLDVTAREAEARAAENRARRRTVLGALLFVAGFSTVFVSGTLLASAAGAALREYSTWITRGGGVLVIVLALVFLGFGSQRTFQPSWRPKAGLAGAPLLGVVFGIGWAPCMGPTYAVIYALATNLAGDTGLVLRGALLGVGYCVGLGIPFLLIAAGWQRALGASAWLRRHQRAVHVTGGVLLLAVGVLLVTGAWDTVVRYIQSALVSRFTTVL